MKKKEMKHYLKKLPKPIKKELFNELFNEEEKQLMLYLYIDRINQSWVSDELGISVSTLTKYHNSCLNQVVAFYEFEKLKKVNNEPNSYDKYFILL